MPGGGTKPPVALIAGPTASGKTDLSVRLALMLQSRGQNAAVINADSAQIYRDLAILSARPTAHEQRGIPHLLFGTWDGAHACSAAEWAAAARDTIDQCHAAGTVPILCGGSGLYIRVLLDGIAPIPPIAPEIRKAVRAMSVKSAYAALQAEDPQRAATLRPTDSQRVARALEVVRSTRKTLSHWQSRLEGGIADRIALHPLLLMPPRDVLKERAEKRFVSMLDAGASDEVERLVERRLAPDLPVMRAIGVLALKLLLAGQIDREQAVEQATIATRQYAKRQHTWFSRQAPPDWPIARKAGAIKDDEIETIFLNSRLT